MRDHGWRVCGLGWRVGGSKVESRWVLCRECVVMVGECVGLG